MPKLRFVTAAIAAAMAIVMTACGRSEGGASATESVDGIRAAIIEGKRYETSYIGMAALLGLTQGDNGSQFRKTWDISDDNSFDSGFLLQTPPAWHFGHGEAALPIAPECKRHDATCDSDFRLRLCKDIGAACAGGGICTATFASVKEPGGKPRAMCVGHSDSFYDELYRVMVSGTEHVDVSSLSPPDGRFLAAMRNAITYLSRKPRPPTVRFLFGNFPLVGHVNVEAILQDLTRDVPEGSKIAVSLGAYRVGVLRKSSWNHTKIVAADGKVAVTGGHNLYSAVYLGIDPVHDISMAVNGSAARHAQNFAARLWDYTCSMARDSPVARTRVATSLPGRRKDLQETCIEPNELPQATGPGQSVVFSLGRVGGLDQRANPSDRALLEAVGAARQSIKMSLQDLGPMSFTIPIKWPAEDTLLPKLAEALARDVHVYIVLSNYKALAGGRGPEVAMYEYGWKLEDTTTRIATAFKKLAQGMPGFATQDAVNRQLCTFLHVAPLRFSDEAHWAPKMENEREKVRYANHAKAFAIDDRAFYVGSQNFYGGGDLAEHGFLVDDPAVTQTFLDEYFTPLWDMSKVAAVTGGESGCMFQ